MNIRDEFTRTKCACDQCRQCCRHMPAMLIPGDLQRIAEYQGVSTDAVEQMLAASPGALVGKVINGVMITGRIPTIVPMQKPEGGCVFLDENENCAIHEVAPFGCSHFDRHMTQAEGDERSKAAIIESAQNKEYRATWERLVAAGRITETPDKKRQAMRNESEKP